MRAAALALILTAFACARAVSIGTGTGPIYSVMIENSIAEDMIVSYDAGNGPATLGTVRANNSQSFTITAPVRTTVTITATNAARTRSAGPYNVSLSTASRPTVILR